MRRITLLYLGRKGAGNTYSIEMTNALLKRGCIIQCILSKEIENKSEWENLRKEFSSLHILYINTYTNKFSFVLSLITGLFKYQKEKAQIKAFKPDFIYIPMLSLLSFYLIPSRIPIVSTIHDVEQHMGEKNYLIARLFNITIKRSHKIIVLSKKFIEQVHLKYQIDKQNIIVIPHACFTSYLPKQYKPNLKTIHKRILFFGRIYPYKGLSILLQALSIVIPQIPNIKLRIAGNGEITYEEKSLINKMQKNIELHIGWIDNKEISSLIEDVDMLILPYIEASQSGVIPLSYSFGKMVVATNVGGLSEQIYNNTGLLIKPNNIKELANTIIKLYQHPEDIIQMGEKAYITANEILNWNHSADILLEMTKNL